MVAAAALAAVAASGCGGASPAASGQSQAGGGPGSPTAAASSGGAATRTPGPTATRTPSPTASGQSAATVDLRVVFVDVGQGDATALRSGSWSGLVDGGPAGSEAAVDAALVRLGVRRLDVLVVSHQHADHTGGLPALVKRYRPRVVWLTDKAEGALASALRSAGTVVKRVRRGVTARFGKAKATVIAPGGLSGDANTDSIVLLVQAGGRRLVLTGDSTGRGEAAAGASLARGPPVDVLKVAHHGSRSSTTSGFVAGARPRVAVISVGRNSYGHPTDEVVQRLREAGARVYSTQKHGSVTLSVTSRGRLRWGFSRASRPLTHGVGR